MSPFSAKSEVIGIGITEELRLLGCNVIYTAEYQPKSSSNLSIP
jgi:hypothetical protein